MPSTNDKIVGRLAERERLEQILASQEAELVAVYGRRRVGKTHLIREFFEPRATSAPSSRSVVFLDELPWLSTRRSMLLQTLDQYWNTRLCRIRSLRFIVCGSAASWMLDKLVHAKGGLHNRITRRLQLLPFGLAETQEYLASRQHRWNRRQVLELYLALGGIPHYLRLVERRHSAAQAVGSLCFDRAGELHEQERTKTRKQVRLVPVCPGGMKRSIWSEDLSAVVIDDSALFAH
ncbi:MAG: hypothetical protein V2A76_05550 [Planctomycetota bacterium]